MNISNITQLTSNKSRPSTVVQLDLPSSSWVKNAPNSFSANVSGALGRHAKTPSTRLAFSSDSIATNTFSPLEI